MAAASGLNNGIANARGNYDKLASMPVRWTISQPLINRLQQSAVSSNSQGNKHSCSRLSPFWSRVRGIDLGIF